MIGRADLVARVREWGLREDVVEKDYVLGWLLWGIAEHPVLGNAWVFKGGTCLKKCYIETYRFSEDLDFTVMPDGPIMPEQTLPLLAQVLDRVGQESGIDFSLREPRLRPRPSGLAAEARVYYGGPRRAPMAASVKLDLSADEVVVRPPVLRPIAHPYPDAFPTAGRVRCYSFEEVFAEKIRAMGQRSRPRDLYDIVNLFRRHDLRLHPALIRDVLVEKCITKGVPLTNITSIQESKLHDELVSEWESMLAHQLPALPPIEAFLDELPVLFAWLEGSAEPSILEPILAAADEDLSWSPPPTVAAWGAGIPLETVRFAATNHLCIELGYQGSVRVSEPYSLRRRKAGDLVLHTLRADNRQHRAYRVDRIESVKVTTLAFQPAYAIEFSVSEPMAAPPTARVTRGSRPPAAHRSAGSGPTYTVGCVMCGRRFIRKRRNLVLRPHNDPAGASCPGRRGSLVDVH